ncbi:MAG TPA: HD domain-containing protein [Candidatus Rubrimentiphilum sp.]|nr:HD domain-containing protein [Candidatus Rubrimentiphilum sp.]
MRFYTTVMLVIAFAGALGAGSRAADTSVTATGIPLDAPWKVTVYQLARSTFKHPAWGWQHSERNYRVALALAQGDGLKVDDDVLFAASFLHDMGAFQPCADPKMEHGDCAAVSSEAILRSAGFPMQKYAAVAAAERGHMYYRDPGTQPEAIVLHDADSLDFLGAVGAARMLSLTGAAKPDFAPAVKSLRSFLNDIPPKLVTRTARAMAVVRVAELRQFLDALDRETFNGKAM